jgi:hypothetical protein
MDIHMKKTQKKKQKKNALDWRLAVQFSDAGILPKSVQSHKMHII